MPRKEELLRAGGTWGAGGVSIPVPVARIWELCPWHSDLPSPPPAGCALKDVRAARLPNPGAKCKNILAALSADSSSLPSQLQLAQPRCSPRSDASTATGFCHLLPRGSSGTVSLPLDISPWFTGWQQGQGAAARSWHVLLAAKLRGAAGFPVRLGNGCLLK